MGAAILNCETALTFNVMFVPTGQSQRLPRFVLRSGEQKALLCRSKMGGVYEENDPFNVADVYLVS